MPSQVCGNVASFMPPSTGTAVGVTVGVAGAGWPLESVDEEPLHALASTATAAATTPFTARTRSFPARMGCSLSRTPDTAPGHGC